MGTTGFRSANTVYQVVIDTYVLIAALRSKRGASHQLLRTLGDPRWQMNISTALILEYEEIMSRTAVHGGLSPAMDAILDRICALGTECDIFFRWRPHLRDPDDDFLLELAVRAHCDFIITYNTRNFAGAADFGIELVTPGEFLKRIEEEAR